MKDALVVSEIFGPTIQGEGPSAGRRCGFVRLGMCNLDCSWCDTPYTWDFTGKNGVAYDRSAFTHASVADLCDRVEQMDVPMVVVSGGEPMVQRRALEPFVFAMRGRRIEVEIETNGTLDPGPDLLGAVHRWNCSPKIGNSGVESDKAIRPGVLEQLIAGGNVAFKFVCVTPADVDEVAAVVERLALPRNKVWIMPEGVTAESGVTRARQLAGAAIEHGFNLTLRQHVLLWGNERGR